MYVEEIISPDHTGVFLVLPQKDFPFSCVACILSNGKHFHSKVRTLFSISLLLVLIFQGFFFIPL